MQANWPSQIFIHLLLLQRLHVKLHGTFVEVRQQRLCVSNQEVELVRRHLLQHEAAHRQQVAAPLDHQLVGEAAMESAEHKAADEGVLNGALRCALLAF